MFVNENHTDWDEKLPCLLMAHRSTPQESTQCSPNLLVLGRETELPIDLMFGRPPDSDFHEALYYVDRLQARMDKTPIYARVHLGKSAVTVRQKRNYDHRIKGSRLQRGDQVWLFTPIKKKGLSPKLQTFWSVPFAIMSRLSDQVYRIQLDAKSKAKIVHHDRLFRYHGV